MREATDVQTMLIETVSEMFSPGAAPSRIETDDDLTKLGLSSLDMVSLMLTVEAKLDVTIPPAEINPQNFRSIAAIAAMVERLPVS